MKHKIIIFILTVVLLSASATIHANAILGDVNQDSMLDANDAYAILEHSASIGAGNGGTLFDKALISADFSADGKVNAKDAFKILVFLSKSGKLILNESEKFDTTDKWKQAYAIQLDNLQSYQNHYELADINGDSIPELFIMLKDTSETMVYTYQNGTCQQIHFQTESGAVTTGSMYVSSEFNGLIVSYYSNCRIDTFYEIDKNLQAIPKHKLIRNRANNHYYFDDTPMTSEEYDNYYKSAYQIYQLYDTTNRDLLNIYGTGNPRVNFIKKSIQFEKGWLTFDVTCNHITEKFDITFHVVPHNSEHIAENAMEYTDIEFYMSNLYEAVHNDFHAYCVLGEIPDGDYDLFLLADDGTELNSITFTVEENQSVYID